MYGWEGFVILNFEIRDAASGARLYSASAEDLAAQKASRARRTGNSARPQTSGGLGAELGDHRK